MVPYEAFLAEKPVVTTTDAGGPLEVVTDRVTGLVAEPRAEALAAAFASARPPTTPPPGAARAARSPSASPGTPRSTGCFEPMRVAYYSPLPPSRSGIADYSALLLPALEERMDVVVATPRPVPPDAEGGRRPLPRRQRPGRARLDRRGARRRPGRRRPARVRPPPPRLRDHARPRRRRGLLRRARARGGPGGPRARARRRSRAGSSRSGRRAPRIPARRARCSTPPPA